MARYNFSKTIVHSGLNKTKTIYGNSRYEIAYKEQIQIKQWEEQWQRKLQIERNRKIAEEKRLERENRAKDDDRAILNAQILTKQAEEQRADIGNILIDSLECEMYEVKSKFVCKFIFQLYCPSMMPLSSGDLIDWSLVCHSTLSYQKFCDRHSNHYDHPEELHQSVE